ncbi:hypothetical protein GCM10010440_35790 [Kitasatospora cinereorecta]
MAVAPPDAAGSPGTAPQPAFSGRPDRIARRHSASTVPAPDSDLDDIIDGLYMPYWRAREDDTTMHTGSAGSVDSEASRADHHTPPRPRA